MVEGPGADSEEKHEPVSDIDTAAADRLKVLDLKRPIREADMPEKLWGVLVIIEPIQLHRPEDLHLEVLKAQIARCLEKELSFRAEERRERAQLLGIEWITE